MNNAKVCNISDLRYDQKLKQVSLEVDRPACLRLHRKDLTLRLVEIDGVRAIQLVNGVEHGGQDAMIVSVESPSQGPEILERVFAALREVCGFADIDVPRYLEANPNWVYELFGERKGKYGDDAETEVA